MYRSNTLGTDETPAARDRLSLFRYSLCREFTEARQKGIAMVRWNSLGRSCFNCRLRKCDIQLFSTMSDAFQSSSAYTDAFQVF